MGALSVALSLIQRGADADTPDSRGDTPLHHACNLGIYQVGILASQALLLLFRFFCVFLWFFFFFFFFFFFCFSFLPFFNPTLILFFLFCVVQVVKALVEGGAAINDTNAAGWSPLLYAISNGYEDASAVLLEAGADPDVFLHDCFPLYFAVKDGSRRLIRLILKAGCDVNRRHSVEGTPLLMLAASRAAFEDECLLMVEAGADVADRDVFGNTALHYAASQGKVKLARGLLRSGTVPPQVLNATNNIGATPLALAYKRGDTDVVDVLLAAGASDGSAPVATVATAPANAPADGAPSGDDRPGAASASAAAEPLIVSAVVAGDVAMVDRLLGANPASVAVTARGMSLLSLAVDSGSLAVVETLLDHGAAVNAVNEADGSTALTLAIAAGAEPIYDALLANDADPNLQTPLHTACAVDNVGLAAQLLGLGARGTMPNDRRETAFAVSVRHGATACGLLLLEQEGLGVVQPAFPDECESGLLLVAVAAMIPPPSPPGGSSPSGRTPASRRTGATGRGRERRAGRGGRLPRLTASTTASTGASSPSGGGSPTRTGAGGHATTATPTRGRLWGPGHRFTKPLHAGMLSQLMTDHGVGAGAYAGMPTTALHLAASAGSSPAVQALAVADPDAVGTLDHDGCTPLMRACAGGHEGSAIALFNFLRASSEADSGPVDISAPDATGRSLLDYAIGVPFVRLFVTFLEDGLIDVMAVAPRLREVDDARRSLLTIAMLSHVRAACQPSGGPSSSSSPQSGTSPSPPLRRPADEIAAAVGRLRKEVAAENDAVNRLNFRLLQQVQQLRLEMSVVQRREQEAAVRVAKLESEAAAARQSRDVGLRQHRDGLTNTRDLRARLEELESLVPMLESQLALAVNTSNVVSSGATTPDEFKAWAAVYARGVGGVFFACLCLPASACVCVVSRGFRRNFCWTCRCLSIIFFF